MKNIKFLNILILVLICGGIYSLYRPIRIENSNLNDDNIHLASKTVEAEEKATINSSIESTNDNENSNIVVDNSSKINTQDNKEKEITSESNEEKNIVKKDQQVTSEKEDTKTSTIDSKKQKSTNSTSDNNSEEKINITITDKKTNSEQIKSEDEEDIKKDFISKDKYLKHYQLEKENNVYAPLSCYEFDTKTGTIKNYKNSSNCPKNLIIPEKINNVKVSNIGTYAFSGKGLVSIELPKGIVEIESYAFYNNNLKQVVIPYATKKVGSYAFAKNNLTAVVSREPENRISISKNAFSPFNYNDIEWPEVAEIPPSPIKLVEK